MSLSKPASDKPLNPAQKFIKFKGGEGKFQYYDKTQEKEIVCELPMTFMVLDELSTITGWHEVSQSAIYANEVHSVVKEDLNVRAFKGGELGAGKYKYLKLKVKADGGKYTKSIYALDLKTGEIINFHLTGAAVQAWINKEIVTTDNAVKIEKFEDCKKGSVAYKVPVFESVSIEKEIYDKAIKIDEEVMIPYFEEYKAYTQGFENKEVEKSFDKQFEGSTPDDIPEINRESDVKPEDLPF